MVLSRRDLRSLAGKGAARLLAEYEGEAVPISAVMPSGRFVPGRVRAMVDHLARRFGNSELSPAGAAQRTLMSFGFCEGVIRDRPPTEGAGGRHP